MMFYGAKGSSGKIYLNKGMITLRLQINRIWCEFWRYAASFFDADNDGDIDLLVGSGGNEKSDQANYKTACIWMTEKEFYKRKK
jgi:hypothetical protein